ncbi:snRNA-activating protein complex subunit 3-like [Octopus sinensis]|uniref:snRNA-activating protein complex subunit 3 n=1 Tax=Octopus sinensis TaxID=2607531 RepID=A0A7E6EM85_9MOLL|nr:snRNA-activating protein complex subunit 3-like [Octopus sinensis]
MQQSKIYWDVENYQKVERIFRSSVEFCNENEVWRLNVAHVLFMQEKYKEAISFYEPITVDISAIILANLCVSYIMINRNEEAEEIMRKIEKDELQNSPIPEQEYVVLGHQYLSNLRDAIRCPRDLEIAGDLSSRVELEVNHNRASEWARNFTGNCKWREKLSKSGVYKMEGTQFSDLTVQLGYPYVYMHQGNCQHVVVFSDVRLPFWLDFGKYPLRIGKSKRLKMACQCCKMFVARWITTQNNLCPHDPCYLCQSCYSLLCFDESGNKIGNFVTHYYAESDFVL